MNLITSYIQKLGNNYLLIDFNAHSKLLDTRCVKPNFTGKSLESRIVENNVCLATSIDFYTYVNPSSGKRSCLDLCLSSSSIAPLINIS